MKPEIEERKFSFFFQITIPFRRSVQVKSSTEKIRRYSKGDGIFDEPELELNYRPRQFRIVKRYANNQLRTMINVDREIRSAYSNNGMEVAKGIRISDNIHPMIGTMTHDQRSLVSFYSSHATLSVVI